MASLKKALHRLLKFLGNAKMTINLDYFDSTNYSFSFSKTIFDVLNVVSIWRYPRFLHAMTQLR